MRSCGLSVVEGTGLLVVVAAFTSLSIKPDLIITSLLSLIMFYSCLSTRFWLLERGSCFQLSAVLRCPLHIGGAQGTLRKQMRLRQSGIVLLQETENDSSKLNQKEASKIKIRARAGN